MKSITHSITIMLPPNPFINEMKEDFLELIGKPHVRKVILSGSEPLAYEKLPDIYDLVKEIKQEYPNKKIWLYTGFELTCGVNKKGEILGDFANADIGWDNGLLRNHIIRNCDVVVDSPYKDGCVQRFIDVKKTIKNKKITLYKWEDKYENNNTRK